MMLRAPFVFLALGLLLAAPCALAEIAFATPFQDHAILQRDQNIPVWGTAAAGERITITFRDQTVRTTAGSDGRWVVLLEPISAQIEPAELTATGTNTVVIKDVLVGEVWLASGQSNMERRLSSLPDATTRLPQINNPFIRHLTVTKTLATSPAETVPTSGWQSATPATAGDFSAVAWFFSAELQRKLGVPIGIIHSSWGGSTIETWMDPLTLKSVSSAPAIEARWQKLLSDLPALKSAYAEKRAAWDQAEATAKAAGKKNALTKPSPIYGPGTQHSPQECFNGMIAPLQPYALRGVIWYQGESNWDHPSEYAELFPAMITAWRTQWGQPDLPFYFVQLPNFEVADDPSGRLWAQLREAQTSALTLPSTAMAVTIDCGDPKDIHPQNKPIVGRRLAHVAESLTYGLSADWCGPRFASARREGSAMRVSFEHASAGLIAERKLPQSFELAGADRKFYPATALIERDTVVVKSPQVPEPAAVRYAWSNSPVANLYNGNGLPAAPFRSDDW